MNTLSSPDPDPNRATVPALFAAAVLSLLAGAYVAGDLGGPAGFGAGCAGFAGYLVLFGLAFRRLGLRRLFLADPRDPEWPERNAPAPGAEEILPRYAARGL